MFKRHSALFAPRKHAVPDLPEATDPYLREERLLGCRRRSLPPFLLYTALRCKGHVAF